jgi:hypothetical protein
MSRLPRVFFLSLICVPGFGQSVISASSGVVDFAEGAAFVDDKPLQQKFGSFRTIKTGATLRTEDGRVEVLLTPGLLLRLDRNSAFRMDSTDLVDTRIEFLKGSAMVEAVDEPSDHPAVIKFKDNEIRFDEEGLYRIDAEPGLLKVFNGEAVVKRTGKETSVDMSHEFFLDSGLLTPAYGDPESDEFYAWSKKRSATVDADSKLSRQASNVPKMPDGTKPAGDTDDDNWDDNATLGGLVAKGILSAAPSLGTSTITPYPGLGVYGSGTYAYPGAYPGLSSYSHLYPGTGLGTYNSLPLNGSLLGTYGAPYTYPGAPYLPYSALTMYGIPSDLYRYSALARYHWLHGIGSPQIPSSIGIIQPWLPARSSIGRPSLPTVPRVSTPQTGVTSPGLRPFGRR